MVRVFFFFSFFTLFHLSLMFFRPEFPLKKTSLFIPKTDVSIFFTFLSIDQSCVIL